MPWSANRCLRLFLAEEGQPGKERARGSDQALRCPGEPGGFTNDELRIDENFAACHLLVFRLREQIFKNSLANLLAWNMHGS